VGVATEVEQTPGGAESVSAEETRNWFGDLVSRPQVVLEARSIEDIVAAVRDADRYPSPVRARGSAHSTTLCGQADGGTVIDMTRMNRILDVGENTVTVEAGALFVDVAKELEQRGLQFYVNIELGNASMGSLACCATKDGSMPGEFGQANSYCVGMKLVTPSGEILEVNEEDPGLLQAARSSYGLLGVVCEATFKIRPLQAMALEHRVFKLDEFERKLPELMELGQSVMMYIYPYLDRITVELRKYTGPAGETTSRPSHLPWRFRNYAWKSLVPGFGYVVERFVPATGPRYRLVNGLNRVSSWIFFPRLKAGHTVPTDQIIRYPKSSTWSRYTFSIWAFPEEQYAKTLRKYFKFAKDYYRRTNFRPNMVHVGYRIEQDDSSLFSYTYDARVMTIDPVSTGAPGWRDFLEAYNEFCSEHGGKPLFNQTWGLKPHHVRQAFGDRIERFEEYRRRHDPADRMLNPYFRELLQGG
jgi:FAD/FMN-containing dehydrogenase